MKTIKLSNISKWLPLEKEYLTDARVKRIKLSEVKTPNNKSEFQDNLRRFNLTTSNDELIVRTGKDTCELVKVKKLKSMDDVYKICGLGYHDIDYTDEMSVINSERNVKGGCLLSTVFMKEKWHERCHKHVRVIHDSICLENPSVNLDFYKPNDDEIELFDLSDDYTKEYMLDKYYNFDMSGHFERCFIYQLYGKHSGYVLDSKKNVLQWSQAKTQVYLRYLNATKSLYEKIGKLPKEEQKEILGENSAMVKVGDIKEYGVIDENGNSTINSCGTHSLVNPSFFKSN